MASNNLSHLDGDGNSSDWIEIHNPTDSTFDLDGWHLTDDSGDLTAWAFPDLPQSEIPANGHLVVYASGQAIDNYLDADQRLHTNFKLKAAGEYLGLVMPDGTTVTSEFAPEYPTQSTDVSFGLNANDVDVYFGNPTPGTVNDDTSIVTVQVMISEIMYHPESDNNLEEYIELYNAESTTIDLTDWELTGAVDFVLPAVSLAPGEYLVVAADEATFTANHAGVTNFVAGWEGKLSNRRETIILQDASGVTVDNVSYADEGAWATRERGPLDAQHEGWIWSNDHDGGGSSLELVGLNIGNDSGQNWAASTTLGGTPSVANSTADNDGDVAPLILDVEHNPVIPRSTDNVVITARLTDELATGVTAQLFWRIDGAGNFSSTPMLDDGNGSDATAGDDVYTALLPPQVDGAIVEFYIESEDAANNTRTTPAPVEPSGQQLANFLYQVDDSFTPGQLPAVGESSTYRLIMTEDERAELEQIGSNPTEGRSHARMNGTVIFLTSAGVETRYQVGIRNRGAGSRYRQPNSYHLDIPSDQAWSQLDAMNLNTQFTHLQHAGMQLFQAAGEVSENSEIVQVRVNGSNLSGSGEPAFGVYAQLESPGQDFVTAHFPDDDGGNLYKMVRSNGVPGGDLTDRGTTADDYRDFYEKKTNASADDYTDLLELIDVLNRTSDAEYLSRLKQVVNIDSWLSYFAITTILSNEETSIADGTGDDYLMYRGENDPRFVLIPHDMDTIFGQGDTASSPTSTLYPANGNATVARFLTHPEIISRYHDKLKSLLETTFAKNNLDPMLDDLLADFTPANLIADMKSFMDQRRQFILDEITKPLTATSGLPLTGGFHRTTQNIAAVSGTASLAETQSVLVNGQAAVWDSTNGTWSLGEGFGGQPLTLINEGATWDYLDAGQVASTSPGSDWRVDDPGWSDSGPAQLGYGDGDEATTVDYIDTDSGQSGTQKNITTYFRRTFNITDAATFTSLSLRLLRDDGAVVFLNGTEVLRSNMPAGLINADTRASSVVSGSNEDTFLDFALNPADLVEGENVIAVEIHQENSGSSDISFDLELRATTGDSTATDGIPLNPGVNRLWVESFDGPNGTGNRIDATPVDVWYDNGSTQTVGGTISTNTTWTAAAGPYVVTSDLTINDGTLTIEPGTSVFFNAGTGLNISGNGQILAEGTAYERIRLTRNPAAGNASWEGISLTNTSTDNRFTYIDIEAGDDSGQAVFVDHGTVLFDHAAWFGVNAQVFDLEHPTILVSNSDIPSISGDETIHLVGLDLGEQMIFDGNVIGKNLSGDDVVDMGHSSPNPATVIFRNNLFLGGLDDGIDTDGFETLIENNIFTDFHLDTPRATTSNAVTTGRTSVNGEVVSSNLTLINNLFFNNDHDILLKDLGYVTATNNTFVGATIGSIQFTEIGGTNVLAPGLGIALDGNIFWDAAQILQDLQPESELSIHRSIVPAELTSYGVGNIVGDPLLVDPANLDFRLREFSPALGAGPNGTDIGGVQMPRYTAANETNLRITELNYNPYDGFEEYGEIPADGDWFEFIELLNTSSETIDLSHVALVNGIDFEFDWGTSLEPNERVLIVKNQDVFESRYGTGLPIAGEYTDFTQLKNGGEKITMLAANATIIQEFSFDNNGDWPGRADGKGASLEVINTAGDYDDPENWQSSNEFGGSPGIAGTGKIYDVIVNEVLSHSDGALLDKVELYNTTDAAVDLEGWHLSDTTNDYFLFTFGASTTIGAGEYLVLDENQLGFALDGQQGDDIWFIQGDADGQPLRFADHHDFDATDTNVSLGRVPNGDPTAQGATLFPVASQTFGAANTPFVVGDVVISEIMFAPAPVPTSEADNISQSELEYIELYNTSGSLLDLGGWKLNLEGGDDIVLATNTLLPIDSTLLIVRFDPAIEPDKATAFRNVYNLDAGVTLIGPFGGKLSDEGEQIKLMRPEEPAMPETTGFVLVDLVSYDDAAPWPTEVLNTGNALQRNAATDFGNFAASWNGATASPGTTFSVPANPADFEPDGDVDGDDLAIWETGYGINTGASTTQGDTDADGDVDGADFLTWQRNFSATTALATPVTPLSALDAPLPMPQIVAASTSTNLASSPSVEPSETIAVTATSTPETSTPEFSLAAAMRLTFDQPPTAEYSQTFDQAFTDFDFSTRFIPPISSPQINVEKSDQLIEEITEVDYPAENEDETELAESQLTNLLEE